MCLVGGKYVTPLSSGMNKIFIVAALLTAMLVVTTTAAVSNAQEGPTASERCTNNLDQHLSAGNQGPVTQSYLQSGICGGHHQPTG